MPTRITIKNRKFFRELENGNSYSLNTNSFGSHLKGSVMNRLKMTADVSIYTYEILTNYNFKNVSPIEKQIYKEGGGFNNLGIFLGDEIIYRYEYAGIKTATGVITSISDDLIIYNITSGDSPPDSGYGLDPDRIKLQTISTDLKYNYNIQEQLESFDLQSLINQGDSSFIVRNIGVSFEDGRWSETNKSIKNGGLKCLYVNSTPDDDPKGSDDVVHNYKIEHEFILTPYYLEGWDLDGQLPDIYKNSNTVRYVADYGFRRGYNNPNTQINGIDDNGLGSVGALGETFNGFEQRYFNNSYKVTDVNDFDLSGINVASVNKIKFNVTNNKSSGGFLTNQHAFVAYISKKPDFDKYQFSKTDDFETIWGFGSSRGLLNNGSQSLSGYFSLSTINIIDDQNAEVELLLSFPVDYVDSVENDDKYILAFEVGDVTQVIDNSDSCNLLLEEGTFSKDINIPDLVINKPFEIKRTSDANTFSDYKGWIQHGVNVSNGFSMSIDNNALIESVSVGIIAQKDNDFFDVYRYNYNLSSMVNSSGIQNVNIEDSQNYKLQTASIFNEIKLRNTGQTTPNKEDYELEFSVKIPYQDWQLLSGVPNVFYNSSKELNGFNKNASNYTSNGYVLKFFLDINASQFGIDTLYRNLSPELDILDFGSDGNVVPLWNANISTFNNNNDNLDGSILTNEKTKIIATFNAPSPLSNPFGVIRIGEDRHGGNSVDELTNNTGFPENNRLKPLDSEINLKVTQVGSQIVLECETDFEQLKNANHIVCAEVFDADNPVLTMGAFSDAFSDDFDN